MEEVAEEIVKLNVGGTKFLTTRTTLCSKGENFFTTLINGRIPSTKYEGYYFIDRDGNTFKYVLEFLRTGHFEIPNDISEQAILREIQFYGIDLTAHYVYISGTFCFS
jgi:hypothetical protein